MIGSHGAKNMSRPVLFACYICILGLLFLLQSCNKNLSSIETRLDNLEEKEKCVLNPKLESFIFLISQNPYQLSTNVAGRIVNDSIVECRVPHVLFDKSLIANFTYSGDSITINHSRAISEESVCDYKKPVRLSVFSGSAQKDYWVYVYSYNGLPIITIDTEDRKEIVSKVDYLKANFKLVENVVTRAAGDVVEAEVNIRGRGNATWDVYPFTAYPKKPYRLKFDKKISLFDGPQEKSYVLLANVIDKTSLRNQTAFFMSEISDLDYTPKFHFVDLFLNGKYEGIYQLGDKLSISKNRVNVGDDGYLLEIDFRAVDEIATYFFVEHLKSPVNIKEPDMDLADDRVQFIKEYVTKADSVLFSDNFTDKEEGWQKYFDITSFVDWYLINELSRNGDAVLGTSCYMSLKKGGKLKMGPVWDFDTAFGNNNTNETTPADGYYIKDASWFNRMYEDPVFVNKVKERFSYFYNHRYDIYLNIDNYADYIRYSVIENNNRWQNLYKENFDQQAIWGGYFNEVQFMKNWLENRFQWFNNEFYSK